ncbi:hypothetical protein CI1B_65400 [Bradyrhizobium ivorense]|uniref:Uncharacterized protein n=1 Tax=Bradyrhizobium ivorense TaxID=2511166 RepID=A0A508TQH2_9BRAD|nr:hypothetical protein [Bradyrhizobium ivorense]VIO76573.1 hypothetical protein CI1B_65400 [Bradyrhizobium ivorense]
MIKRGNPLFINFGELPLKQGVQKVPQIWMTYREIAEMLGCDADAARATTIQRELDRKKSRDGLTRVKLDPELTARFISMIRNADAALNQAVQELRNMHEMMARRARSGGHSTIYDDGGFAVSG